MFSSVYRHLFYFYLFAVIGFSIIPLGNDPFLSRVTVVDILRLDYLLHALLFIPLVSLWRFGLPGHSWWIVVAGGLSLAAFCELIQLWVPYRGYNINDLIGNMTGMLLGIPVYYFLTLPRVRKIMFFLPSPLPPSS
jgi:glycopeptide antibiotics resistance protein